MPQITHIGQAIRAKRLEKGLTLAELAAKVDKATSYLSAVENGKYDVTTTQLLIYAKGLDCRAEELIAMLTSNEGAA